MKKALNHAFQEKSQGQNGLSNLENLGGEAGLGDTNYY